MHCKFSTYNFYKWPIDKQKESSAYSNAYLPLLSPYIYDSHHPYRFLDEKKDISQFLNQKPEINDINGEQLLKFEQNVNKTWIKSVK